MDQKGIPSDIVRKLMSEYAKCHLSEVDIRPERPSNCNTYLPTLEPCWYVYVPWGDGKIALRSSRVIIMSKATGKILYEGGAGDEG
ncbi:MAG TPA: hypothetical protein DET40_04895 [Lentisphaeria bacterium]|nr:MAG: hypothetical protein A2X45_13470 [Lentisphaerae bacterium GWF2_50_93]HCE42863.1 hypothetical protein [Lentisphaeria bacterium]